MLWSYLVLLSLVLSSYLLLFYSVRSSLVSFCSILFLFCSALTYLILFCHYLSCLVSSLISLCPILFHSVHETPLWSSASLSVSVQFMALFCLILAYPIPCPVPPYPIQFLTLPNPTVSCLPPSSLLHRSIVSFPAPPPALLWSPSQDFVLSF